MAAPEALASPPSSPSKTGAPAATTLGLASAASKRGDHEAALAEVQEYLAPYSKGAVNVEAVQATANAIRLCNELALTCMRDAAEPKQLDFAYAYLKFALKAPNSSPALRAVTFNNAGIYYARTNQPQAALRCLERVGKQGGVVVEDDVSVHVKLNTTTVLADLGRHAEALEVAQEAVQMLTRAERAGKSPDSALLSAAYHNLAVQQERLGATKGHVRSYRAALMQARKAGATPMQSFMEQAYTHARYRSNQPGSGSSPSELSAATTSAVGMADGSGGSPSRGGMLPPVRAATSTGGRPPKLSGSFGGSGGVKGPYGYGGAGGPVPRARSSHSESGRRPPQSRARPSASAKGGGGGGGGAPYVSLDDVYSGKVAVDTVPYGGLSQSPGLVPPPGYDPDAAKRHAPRSAGTARVTAAA